MDELARRVFIPADTVIAANYIGDVKVDLLQARQDDAAGFINSKDAYEIYRDSVARIAFGRTMLVRLRENALRNYTADVIAEGRGQW